MMMREGRVRCMSSAGYHHMHYTEWGDADNPRVLLCVHGLSRCGRDFDTFAAAMADRYRVICPDVAGRGQSDWLADKMLYAVPQYCLDMNTLLAALGAERVDWVGTSMGGLIGIGMAAPAASPIRRLVLNDVGPVITAVSLQRIGEYLGKAPRFDSIEQAEQFVRFVSASFGQFSDAQWRKLTTDVTRPAADGKIEFSYDPGIAQAFAAAYAASGGQDIDLWPLYDAVRCPTLLVRGGLSDLLRADTADEMTRRGPRACRVEVAGVGHAPMLMSAEQIAPVREFLLAGD